MYIPELSDKQEKEDKELKIRIEQLLDKLGTTADEITKNLKQLNILTSKYGWWCSKRCPIYRYLADNSIECSVGISLLSVDNSSIVVSLKPHQTEFIRMFDRGLYPELML